MGGRVTLALAAASLAAVLASDHHKHHTHDVGPGLSTRKCRLIEGFFAYLVQGLLGVVALSALFVKREFFESPQRPWIVWVMDCSKQGLSSVTIHVFNIFLSMFLASIDLDTKGHVHSDECAWYFINYMVDALLGVFFCWLFLQGFLSCASKFSLEAVRTSGYYGNPVRVSWWIWQTLSWLAITMVSKFVLALIVFPFVRPLSRFGMWLFGPLEVYPDIELVTVMVVAPAVFNVLSFWVLDNFLMDAPAEPAMQRKRTRRPVGARYRRAPGAEDEWGDDESAGAEEAEASGAEGGRVSLYGFESESESGSESGGEGGRDLESQRRRHRGQREGSSGSGASGGAASGADGAAAEGGKEEDGDGEDDEALPVGASKAGGGAGRVNRQERKRRVRRRDKERGRDRGRGRDKAEGWGPNAGKHGPRGCVRGVAADPPALSAAAMAAEAKLGSEDEDEEEEEETGEGHVGVGMGEARAAPRGAAGAGGALEGGGGAAEAAPAASVAESEPAGPAPVADTQPALDAEAVEALVTERLALLSGAGLASSTKHHSVN